jgi:hypothetical protein
MQILKFVSIVMLLPLLMIPCSIVGLMTHILTVDQAASIFTLYISNPVFAVSVILGLIGLVYSTQY